MVVGKYDSAIMNLLVLGIWLLYLEGTNGFVQKCVRVGIDYGPRLIGISYSDYFGKVYPYTTVKNTGNLTRISEAIGTFATTLSAAEIVLGVPIDNYGELNYCVKNMNGKICLNFSFVLASVIHKVCSGKVKVRLFDERYSTQEARYKRKINKQTASLDAVAAACILERYIEDEGVGSILARQCPYPPPEEIATFNYTLIGTYVGMRHHVEDSEDWHKVKEYVNNYKVYNPPLDANTVLPGETVENALRDFNDDYDEDEEDSDTKQQRAIIAQRRPKGMSKAAWKMRLASANKNLLL